MDEITRQKAIRFYKDANGTVQQKNAFLMKKGLSYMDCLDCMNEASEGALLKSALGSD